MRRAHDRNISTLRPRRELLEALWNYAIYKTGQRRRRAGVRPVRILKVEIWVQLAQAQLIRRYRAHLHYLKQFHALSARTLTRQVAGFRRLGLLDVRNPSRFDRRRREWVQQRNIYTITYLGKLWISRHGRAVKIPLVV